MWFADRQEAGRLLGERLLPLKRPDAVVLAISPGGVPVGRELARLLSAPLDVALAEAVVVPDQKDRIIGAIVDHAEPELVIDGGSVRRLDVPLDSLAAAADAAQRMLRRRRAAYADGRMPAALRDRCVIVVDDGVANTGLVGAVLRATRRAQPAHLLLAVPVGLYAAVNALQDEADEVVCLGTPDDFVSVAQYYRRYPHLSDADAAAILAEASQ